MRGGDEALVDRRESGQGEDIWTLLYRSGFYQGGGGLMKRFQGIDQALWDIKGKNLWGSGMN